MQTKKVGSIGSYSTETNPIMSQCRLCEYAQNECWEWWRCSHQHIGVAASCWGRPWDFSIRKGFGTVLDSWFIAEALCVVQWHARRCILYLSPEVPWPYKVDTGKCKKVIISCNKRGQLSFWKVRLFLHDFPAQDAFYIQFLSLLHTATSISGYIRYFSKTISSMAFVLPLIQKVWLFKYWAWDSVEIVTSVMLVMGNITARKHHYKS